LLAPDASTSFVSFPISWGLICCAPCAVRFITTKESQLSAAAAAAAAPAVLILAISLGEVH